MATQSISVFCLLKKQQFTLYSSCKKILRQPLRTWTAHSPCEVEFHPTASTSPDCHRGVNSLHNLKLPAVIYVYIFKVWSILQPPCLHEETDQTACPPISRTLLLLDNLWRLSMISYPAWPSTTVVSPAWSPSDDMSEETWSTANEEMYYFNVFK